MECTFGAMYTKWGILWKPLQFRLKNNVIVVDSICRLHNFLIDNEDINNLHHRNTSDYIDEDMVDFLSKNDKDYIGIFCNDENISHTQKNTSSIKYASDLGRQLRDMYRDIFFQQNLYRPPTNWWYRDQFNRVCIQDEKEKITINK